MVEILSVSRILKHWSAYCRKFILNAWTKLLFWARHFVYTLIRWTFLLKESTSRGYSVKSMIHFRDGHLRGTGDGTLVVVLVRSRSRIFTHFLHLFHVGESLGSRVETVIWIVFAKVLLELLVTHIHPLHHLQPWRVILLEGQTKGGFGLALQVAAPVSLVAHDVPTLTRSHIIHSFIHIIYRRLISVKLRWFLILWTAILKSYLCWGEDGVLVCIGLLFVILDRLEECSSLHHDVFILDRNHLIKVYSLPLIWRLGRLVIESGGARTNGNRLLWYQEHFP